MRPSFAISGLALRALLVRPKFRHAHDLPHVFLLICTWPCNRITSVHVQLDFHGRLEHTCSNQNSLPGVANSWHGTSSTRRHVLNAACMWVCPEHRDGILSLCHTHGHGMCLGAGWMLMNTLHTVSPNTKNATMPMNTELNALLWFDGGLPKQASSHTASC